MGVIASSFFIHGPDPRVVCLMAALYLTKSVCNATGKRDRSFFRCSNGSDMAKKQSSPTLTKAFVGYGHYQLTVTLPEGEKSAISGDMDLIGRLNSEVQKEREEATKEAIAFVLSSK